VNFKAEHLYEPECALKACDFFAERLDNAKRIAECTELVAGKAVVEDDRQAMGEDAAYPAGELDESALPETAGTPENPRDADRTRMIRMCHGIDVTTIPGISDVPALALLSRFGPDPDR
jgi:hypothetical protein